MSKSLSIFLALIVTVIFGLITGKISPGHIATGFTFLGVLGVLVYIHEAGHFLTARRNKITCHEFGFGFPPRIGGFVKDDKTGEKHFVWGNKEYYGNNTLFSVNWIPLGGFVRIKGENADPHQTTPDKDSFVAQSIWTRFKVLIAGVVMNFILGWILIVGALTVGSPVPVDPEGLSKDINPAWVIGSPQVLINDVVPDSSAQEMGIKTGDSLSALCVAGVCQDINSSADLVTAVNQAKGESIVIEGLRGEEKVTFEGILGNKESGSLGVNMADMVIVKYPFFVAVIEGFMRAAFIMFAIVMALLGLFVGLYNWIIGFVTSNSDTLLLAKEATSGVSGPIGIAQITGQMRDLGFAYLLQFAAILSLNLAVFNALPIPALDGGRILFLMIEKIKGAPVNPKTEGLFHTIFFTILILLMLVITTKEIIEIITG